MIEPGFFVPSVDFMTFQAEDATPKTVSTACSMILHLHSPHVDTKSPSSLKIRMQGATIGSALTTFVDINIFYHLVVTAVLHYFGLN